MHEREDSQLPPNHHERMIINPPVLNHATFTLLFFIYLGAVSLSQHLQRKTNELITQVIKLKKAEHGMKEISELLKAVKSKVKKYMVPVLEEEELETPSQNPGCFMTISQRALNFMKHMLESNP